MVAGGGGNVAVPAFQVKWRGVKGPCAQEEGVPGVEGGTQLPGCRATKTHAGQEPAGPEGRTNLKTS